MNLKNYLDIAPEVKSAVEAGKPVVALESTILSHGMPYPENLTFAAEVERIIRAEGAIPATMAIIDGRMKVGLSAGELELMCKGENVAKVSRRDLPILLATGGTGATTVASTMILASLAGIPVFATGGIGGVHRGATTTMDISADLEEACTRVLAAGVRRVFVSLGADGIYYKGPEGSVHRRSRAFDKLVNATGAGDATMAGIVHATLAGKSESEVLDFALGAGLVAIAAPDTISEEMSGRAVHTMIKEYVQ